MNVRRRLALIDSARAPWRLASSKDPSRGRDLRAILGGQAPASSATVPAVESTGTLCGGGGIRTHGGLATTTVFETVRFVRSRTPPGPRRG